MDEVVPGEGGVDIGGSFADGLFEEPMLRSQLSRREKRAQRREHGLVRAKDRCRTVRQPPPMTETLSVTPAELQQLQYADPSLKQMTDVSGYFCREGIMYRRWVPRGREEEVAVEQITLPRQCRRTVLQIAHTIPLGGHLGKKKTAERIMRCFYWPTLFRDVADFVEVARNTRNPGTVEFLEHL